MQRLKGGRGIDPNPSQPDIRRNQWSARTTLSPFIPCKDSVPFAKESGVGLGTLLDAYEKFRPTLEFEPRTVQPVTIRNTDYAIPVAIYTTTFHCSLTILLPIRIERLTLHTLRGGGRGRLTSRWKFWYLVCRRPRGPRGRSGQGRIISHPLGLERPLRSESLV